MLTVCKNKSTEVSDNLSLYGYWCHLLNCPSCWQILVLSKISNISISVWHFCFEQHCRLHSTWTKHTFMGFRSPSISTAAIFLYQDAARFLLMLRSRLTGSSSSMLDWPSAGSMQTLVQNQKQDNQDKHSSVPGCLRTGESSLLMLSSNFFKNLLQQHVRDFTNCLDFQEIYVRTRSMTFFL